MTSEEFIERIRRVVYESTIEGSLSLLQHPPGRRPSESLVALSQWFNQLDANDRERIREIMQLAARGAIFGVLTVLDGMRAIGETGETGFLELRYTTEGHSVVLNDPSGELLHELFAEKVPPA